MKTSKYAVVNPFPNSWKAILILLLTGLAVIAAGIIFLVVAHNNVQGFVKLDATIVDITWDATNDNQVYVNYTFQGISYTHKLVDSYSSSWKVGQTISIFLDPNNPNPSRVASEMTSSFAPYLVMSFGGVMAALGLTFVGYNLWTAQVFLPRRIGGNQVKAELKEVKPLGHGRYQLGFDVSGQRYWSRGLKGDYPFLQTLLQKQAIETPAYLDLKGHFVPDYKAFNAALTPLQNAAGVAPAPDYKGLDPNDDGSHHF